MPKRALSRCDGSPLHILNRAIRRGRIFRNDADYVAFEKLLADTLSVIPTRLLAYCVMPNHWHLVVWPVADELPRFMHRLTLTHAKRWHRVHGTRGTGPLYQGRYTAVPIASARQLFAVVEYVELNPVRGRLVARPEAWRWSSAWQRRAKVPTVTLAMFEGIDWGQTGRL